jgi:hypothetical protein
VSSRIYIIQFLGKRCTENTVTYFMSAVDSNTDAMQYIVEFILLSFGIISCNSYAHLEDAEMQQVYMRLFWLRCTRFPIHSEVCS